MWRSAPLRSLVPQGPNGHKVERGDLPRRFITVVAERWVLRGGTCHERASCLLVGRLLTDRSSTTTSQTYVHLEAADIKEALLRAGFWLATEAEG
jgi:hypothetical protein